MQRKLDELLAGGYDTRNTDELWVQAHYVLGMVIKWHMYVCIVLLHTLIACHTKQSTCKDHEETKEISLSIAKELSHRFFSSSCLLCPSLGLFNFCHVFLLAQFVALNAKRAWQVEAWRGSSLWCLTSVYQLWWCVWTRGCGRECGTDHASCQQYQPATSLPPPSLCLLPTQMKKTMEKIAHSPCCAMQQQQLRQQQRGMSSSFT